MRSKLRMPVYLLLAVLLLPLLFAAFPAGKAIARPPLCTIYVNGNPGMGDDGWDGSVPVRIPDTLMGPKHSIQMGIEAVCDDGTGTVNIAAGTYSLTGDNHVWISKPLSLTGAGAAGTIIEGSHLVDWEVVSVAHTTVGAVNISNLTITGGPTWGGVWIYADNGTTNFSSCTITGNYACNHEDSSGGGIFVLPGNTVNMTNCTISGNHAGLCLTEQGHASGVSHPALATDADSYTYDGSAGGIYIEGSTLTMNGCKLLNNTANADLLLNAGIDGGMDVSGSGGGMVAIYNSVVNMTDCEVKGNSAMGTGYDVSGSGGGIVAVESSLTMTRCMVSGNGASSGSEAWLPGGGSNSISEDIAEYEFYAAGSGGGIVAIDGPLTMTNCTVQGNQANSPRIGFAANSRTLIGYDVSGSGGGIVAMGPLTMTSCTVRDNTATGFGIDAPAAGENALNGGIGFSSSGSGGGLVALFYPFKIDASTFDNNTATGLGGGIVYMSDIIINPVAEGAGSSSLKWHSGHSLATGKLTSTTIASAEMNDFTLTNNRSAEGGGLVQIGSTLTLNRGTISNNTATAEGGWGGGIFAFINATLNMNDCAVTGNQANRWGGGIFYGLSIGDQPGATISRCHIDSNLAGGGGGGLFVLEAYLYDESIGNESAISGDVPNYRGTLKNLAGFASKSQQFARSGLGQPIPGAVTLNNCTVSNNEAMNWGGGMASVFGGYELHECTFSGNAAGRLGGGIGTFLSIGELVNCTVSGNRLTPIDFRGRLTASNPAGDETLSAGNVQVSSAGGGMGLLTSYTYFECDTIANNSAGSDSNSYGGGLFNSIGVPGASSEFVNTIVANNTAGQAGTNNCYNRGQITSFGHNIDSLNQCGFTAAGDQVNTDPLLGPLMDNGGPTYTCAITTSSPAYGRGDRSNAPDTDQRGVPRPTTSCCIGAYEAIPTPVTIVNPAITSGNPASGTQGQCPMTVVITGTNLSGTTSVSFGPGITVISFTVNSDTQITATICIDANATPGARNVSVTTPTGTWTGTALFTVVSQSLGTGSHSSSLTGSVSLTPPVTNPIVLTSSASLSAKSVTPGTPVTVTADVTNKSAVNGSKKVTLYINGQVESTQGVTVNSGGSTKLTFNVSRSEPGDYSVYVDGIPAGSFRVELFRESDGILILSATLVALAFLIGIVMLWRRQRTGIN